MADADAERRNALKLYARTFRNAVVHQTLGAQPSPAVVIAAADSDSFRDLIRRVEVEFNGSARVVVYHVPTDALEIIDFSFTRDIEAITARYGPGALQRATDELTVGMFLASSDNTGVSIPAAELMNA